MADPTPNAERYELSHDVAADFEETEGPPSGAHTGQDRTRTREHAEHRDHHGPKTTQATRDQFNNRPGVDR